MAYYHISSLNEKRARLLGGNAPIELVDHTKTNLTRVYPRGDRVTSSNFNPQACACCSLTVAAGWLADLLAVMFFFCILSLGFLESWLPARGLELSNLL